MEDRGTIPMQAVTTMVGATVVADDVSRTPKSGETMQLSDSELDNDYWAQPTMNMNRRGLRN